jgi:hypothetical protein
MLARSDIVRAALVELLAPGEIERPRGCAPLDFGAYRA